MAAPARSEAVSQELGRDDYSLSRVPTSERYSWWTVAVQRFGQLSALSQFLLGATLGFGMDFWGAFWAVTLGAVILDIVAIFTGVMGMREGLGTAVLARWTGFGSYGSALVGLVFAISLIGWFGIQNAVFASGLESLVGVLPGWAWSIITGMGVTLIVIYGFLSMAWTAYVTVPLFIALCAWTIGSALSDHSLSELIASPAPGPGISVAAGATLVAGGFIVGAVITPDMTRFNRSVGDVVKQTIIGFTLGEYLIAMIGVLLAHAVQTADVINIVTSEVGAVGAVVLIAATLKINDWNLYSATLGLVNLVHTTFRRRLNRAMVTLVVGVAGTLLSAMGILDRFQDFLVLLGVAIPPIAGIMVAEYFFVRRYRAALDASRAEGALPPKVELINPAMLLSWLAGGLAGHFLTWGVGSLNALIVSSVAYLVLSLLFDRLRIRRMEVPTEVVAS